MTDNTSETMLPCALITSCLGLKSEDLVKSILRVDELPASTCVLEDVVSYPWHVNTKYYTADINLCIANNRTIGNEAFARAVEAIIITFDSTQISSFDQVKMWLPYIKEIGSHVQVLVCERSTDDDAVSRRSLVGWCLDHSFELVELNPVEKDEGSDEDDFKESFGIQRIVEALSCHSWPNMIMKEKPSFRSPYFEQLMSDTAAANKLTKSSNSIGNEPTGNSEHDSKDESNNNAQASSSADSSDKAENTMVGTESAAPAESSSSDSKLSSRQIIDTLISDVANDHGIEEEDEESFEKLFAKLQIMKEAASNLPPDQRKEYAKQVTLQFWKAIGGSPDEIDGLSDSDLDS